MTSKKSKTGKHESRFTKCLKAPFRILGKVKDLYVRSLSDCSGKMNYGGPGAAGPFNNMPRSFSTTSSALSTHSEEDFRELVRAASQRGLVEKVQQEIRRQRESPNNEKLPRSFTVGIGRIDEDKPYEGESEMKAKSELLYPRSKSHAVPKKNSYAL